MTATRRPLAGSLAARTTALAAGAVLSASLLTACASEAPREPRDEAVPTTLAPRPEVKKQKKPKLLADTPRKLLVGVSSASADESWQKSLDLISNWLFNPRYIQRHQVDDIHELDGLARIMTRSAGARWKKQAHEAFNARMHPTPESWKTQLELDARVYQLVVDNQAMRSGRGWDNPMLAPIRVTDGTILSDGTRIGVIMRVSTVYRLIGQGQKYRVPQESALGLTWVLEEGTWKLDQWWRVARFDKEQLKTWRPGQAPPGTSPSATAVPDPTQPTADATLYPE